MHNLKIKYIFTFALAVHNSSASKQSVGTLTGACLCAGPGRGAPVKNTGAAPKKHPPLRQVKMRLEPVVEALVHDVGEKMYTGKSQKGKARFKRGVRRLITYMLRGGPRGIFQDMHTYIHAYI